MSAFCKMYWVHALTPLHVGAGQGAGFIDLPVAREKATGWPFVAGSSVKGVIADHHAAAANSRQGDAAKMAAFGTEGHVGNAGALAFSDARLICLPVRSYSGTFAWATSPMALRRLARDLIAAGTPSPPLPNLAPNDTTRVMVPDAPASVLTHGTRCFFDDLDFGVAPDTNTGQWASALAGRAFPADWQAVFMERFVVVSDTVFDSLSETATQVDARVQIDSSTGTSAGKMLWYEESLPPESLLAGIVRCDRVFTAQGRSAIVTADINTRFCTDEASVQMGGKASVGRGRVRVAFSSGA